jgi:lysyl oxidase
MQARNETCVPGQTSGMMWVLMRSKRRFARLVRGAVAAGFAAAFFGPGAGIASAGEGLLPNIIEEIPQHLAIQNTQQHESLRFSTTHWNFGDGPLQVHGGGQVAPCVIDGVPYAQCTHATQEILDSSGAIVATHAAGVAFFHPEHNHWHQSAVAVFAIRATLDGAPIGNSTLKTTFCLVDLDKSDLVHQNSTRGYFECNGDLQGISVGWGDEYHHSTEGQEIDVTNVPPGTYYLTQDADPDQHWLETNENDNRSWVRFRLSRKGANPEITVLDSYGYAGNSSNK